MRALLKDGKIWVDIDATYLFNNQYNTADGKRIYDRDIIKIRDDARHNMGKCRYCGAMVKRGEEEKHFVEKENMVCAGCFWFRERVKDRKTEATTETKTNENGERVTVNIRTITEQVEKVCTYCERTDGTRKADCPNKECREYGIEWFTPENTFFLKYPDGLASITEVDKLPARGFVVDGRWSNAEYHKKIGSYRLCAILEYENGKPIGVSAYKVSNCRRNYVFRYEGGELFTEKYSLGWHQVKTLDGIPENVMRALKNICSH